MKNPDSASDAVEDAPHGAEAAKADPESGRTLTRQYSAANKPLPELPPNLSPPFHSYLVGYASSMQAILGTVLTMYIAVIAQVAAHAKDDLEKYGTNGGAADAPLTWKLVWILDLFYPVIIAAAILIVAWEVECRKFFFYELMKNGYVISFEASHNELYTLNYWLRPNFGYFPHVALLATAALAVSTRAALSAMSVVIIQLLSLFLFYSKLIDMEAQTPPLGIFVAKHRFFFSTDKAKSGELSLAATFKASDPSRYDIYEAITNACTSMSRLTVLNEENIRLDIRSMILTPDGMIIDDRLINAIGDGGTVPLGAMKLPEPPHSIQHVLANFLLNCMSAGMWGRVWCVPDNMRATSPY